VRLLKPQHKEITMALEQKENFPKPYVNSCKQDDSLMEYVPMDNGDIGSRKSNMKAVKADDGGMAIDHVSNRKGA
jgi:hypothetical protein